MNDNTFTATAVLDEIEFMLNLSYVETTKGKKFFVSARAENQSLFLKWRKTTCLTGRFYLRHQDLFLITEGEF
jgi:hypothetical protein